MRALDKQKERRVGLIDFRNQEFFLMDTTLAHWLHKLATGELPVAATAAGDDSSGGGRSTRTSPNFVKVKVACKQLKSRADTAAFMESLAGNAAWSRSCPDFIPHTIIRWFGGAGEVHEARTLFIPAPPYMETIFVEPTVLLDEMIVLERMKPISPSTEEEEKEGYIQNKLRHKLLQAEKNAPVQLPLLAQQCGRLQIVREQQIRKGWMGEKERESVEYEYVEKAGYELRGLYVISVERRWRAKTVRELHAARASAVPPLTTVYVEGSPALLDTLKGTKDLKRACDATARDLISICESLSSI